MVQPRGNQAEGKGGRKGTVHIFFGKRYDKYPFAKMFFETLDDAVTYGKQQSHEWSVRMLAAYCIHHSFPTTHGQFDLQARETFSFSTHMFGLYNDPPFQIQGNWMRGSKKRRRIVRTYPPVPEYVEPYFDFPKLDVYVELLEDYIREHNFVTLYDTPNLKGDRAIYQVGGTCYLAACLNFALHVPELRTAFFSAFRLKSSKISAFTEPEFRILGNFASEPLGGMLLTLGHELRNSSRGKDPDLVLGTARALMRAFMLRLPGFDELEEHVVQMKHEHLITREHSPWHHNAKSIRIYLRTAFDMDPSLRGGFLSSENREGRHVVAIVRDDDAQEGMRVYNWGVSDSWTRLNEFVQSFPEAMELVLYSLPSARRTLRFDDVASVKKMSRSGSREALRRFKDKLKIHFRRP